LTFIFVGIKVFLLKWRSSTRFGLS